MNDAGRRQQVVFSRHAYAYRATPGNVIVDRSQGDPEEIRFSNFTEETVVVRDFGAGYVRATRTAQSRAQKLLGRAVVIEAARVRAREGAAPELWLDPGGQATLPLTGLPAGQYFYRATVEGTGLEAQGGSGPGIIITD